jgi:hypothetical protein
VGYSKLFLPKALNIVPYNWQVFWLTHFLRPSHPGYTGTVALWCKKTVLSLQLRVQLRNLTGFPLDAHEKASPIWAAKIEENHFKKSPC